MSSNIKIGSVEMPLNDFVVSRNAILGITKSGKTYTAKGVAEQLLEHKIPIIVFDAIGVWRYLKVPAKSHGKGYQVVVAGGSHPDLPLTPESAPEIVRAAIRENIPLIIDLYDAKLSKADWRRIVQVCFRILLYENKGLRHIFLEEAAEYAPQKVIDGVTYAEVEKLARMGGNASLGITFINQRAQELNKAVLELCDNIILLRQRGTHAIDSLEKQMDKLSPDMAKEIALSMPRMTQGDCWIFTEKDEVPVRTRSGLIKSFHPDRTKPDERDIVKVAVNTDAFVATLSGKLEKVIEEAKANDPHELKKLLAAARKQIDVLQKSKTVAGKTEVVEKPALTDAERGRLTKLIEAFTKLEATVEKFMESAHDIHKFKDVVSVDMQFFRNLLAGKLGGATIPPFMVQRRPQPQLSRVEIEKPFRRTITPAHATIREHDGSKLPDGEEKILSACIQYRGGVKREQLTVLTGYKRSTRDAYVYRLKEKGLVELNGELVAATMAGVEALPSAQPLPTGEALQQYHLQRLPDGERKLFEHILAAYPDAIDKDQLTELTGFKRSTRDAYLYRMGAKMLFSDSQAGTVRASDGLFT